MSKDRSRASEIDLPSEGGNRAGQTTVPRLCSALKKDIWLPRYYIYKYIAPPSMNIL